MTRLAWICVVILMTTALFRLGTLGAYPLADTTEARYGEIARVMVEGGDWITPRLEPDVPFWAKPPLSMWITAISFKTLGVSEFSARLPAWLLLLASVALVISFGRSGINMTTGLVAGIIVLTSAIGFISAGAVMTDPALVLTTTLAMVAFWRAVVWRQHRWGYVFFVALALGLLAKGPIALVLSLTPIAGWLFWKRKWAWLQRGLPWRVGPLLLLLIAVPWYAAAEIKTPGFLNYFLVGEHFLRFVDSGWAGDMYGNAHAQPRGTIWLFWIASALPWSLIALWLLIRWRRQESRRPLSEWHAYLVLWAITPMVFFTFAGNLLPAYVLPGIPAFALLLARPIAQRSGSLVHAGWIFPVVFIALGVHVAFDRLEQRSQYRLVSDVGQVSGLDRLTYLYDRPMSANFYSGGKVAFSASPDEALQQLDRPGRDYLVVKLSRVGDLPPALSERVSVVRKYARYVLMVESEKQAELAISSSTDTATRRSGKANR